MNAKPQYRYGFIGNNKHNIPRDVAKNIKLSEILAVSSCFPGGFEPVVFPDDFDFYNNKDCEDFCNGCKSFGLMDGGIVDNQGIERKHSIASEAFCMNQVTFALQNIKIRLWQAVKILKGYWNFITRSPRQMAFR